MGGGWLWQWDMATGGGWQWGWWGDGGRGIGSNTSTSGGWVPLAADWVVGVSEGLVGLGTNGGGLWQWDMEVGGGWQRWWWGGGVVMGVGSRGDWQQY
ncbi:hypothetical protein Acr_00g0091410 [Actinidia rufa]|uniref:Uncharacterized protein n=1 Tax=Actinidia rufa TaxID=165716 RepID=A0A7J0DYD4_9ERIC|nr:hypothetical protein Acr_00g0091410 [Actinidia rufa]